VQAFRCKYALTGRAPHYTDIAVEVGMSVAETRQTWRGTSWRLARPLSKTGAPWN
jgi:hypothetical protein